MTNAGSGSTTGTVTVTDTLPTRLTPTGDNGTINGWSVSTNGQTVTATRSDTLAAGASYPVLTLTVAVSADAAATVTNPVTVAGGGELNAANDSAADATAVAPMPASALTITTPVPVVVGAPFTVTVDAVDALGRVTPAYQGSAVLALLAGPSGSSLEGTLTAPFNNGVAPFTGLSLNVVGAGYTLQASSGTLPGVNSNLFNAFAPTTAAVGARFTALVNGTVTGSGSTTQVAGGGLLNGAAGVYTQASSDAASRWRRG